MESRPGSHGTGDTMTIPVYINVRNRVTTTRELAHQVANLPGAEPILIDNASTWDPLLEWYDVCPFEVMRLRENVGHHAPWLRAIPDPDDFLQRFGQPFYAVTDCDLDIADCPGDLLEVLQEPFGWNVKGGVIKSGLGLRIDDLPSWQQSVRDWESRWWRSPLRDGRFYSALIDTTFALYDCRTPHRRAMNVLGSPAVRTGPPYIARHLPWYLDGDNLDAENTHYFATANQSNSWKPAGKGLAADYLKGKSLKIDWRVREGQSESV